MNPETTPEPQQANGQPPTGQNPHAGPPDQFPARPVPHYPEPEYTPPPAHRFGPVKAQRKKSGKKAWIILAVIAVLAAGAAAYWFILKPEPAKPAATTTSEKAAKTNNSPAATQNKSATPAPAAALKSIKLNLEVTKPAGWTGSEDPATGELTLTSPSTTYTAVNGKTAVFVLKIRQGADQNGQAAIHGASAVQDAETIAYDKPTQNQRYYTNLTIGGQGDNAQFVIVTGADQPKKGESLSRMLINGDVYIIMGGFRDPAATGLEGFSPIPKNTFTASEEYRSAVSAIKSLKIN